MKTNPSIGFVGVGRMGANMALRLRDCGYTIAAVHDTNSVAVDALAAEVGARRATGLAEVTAAADVVFTVVSDDAAQLGIFAEQGDTLLAACEGRVFVNCATLSPGTHVEVARRARIRGAQTLEACMASSIPQARSGTLYLMCGGERRTFEAVREILGRLGSVVRYVGETGKAAQVKALVNMVMNINTAALAEGLALAAALGLDLGMVREVFAETGANSQVLRTDGEDMQNRAHDCFFSAAHAAKDARIACALAREAGVNAPLAEATLAQYDRMVTLGLGALDKSGVAELTFKDRHG